MTDCEQMRKNIRCQKMTGNTIEKDMGFAMIIYD